MKHRGGDLSALVLLGAGLLAACGSSDPVVSAERPVAAAPDARLVAVTGTGVRLAPPAGFVPADEFPGFVHPDSGTSIMVTEIPGPFTEVSSGLQDAAQLARQGMELHEASEQPAGDHPGLLVHLSQTAQGVEVHKWSWVFGTPRESVVLLGTCFDESFLPVVRESILSASWDPEREFAPTEGLGFELGDTAPLLLWRRFGNSLLYTSDGQPDEEQVGKPMLTIGPAAGSGAIEDRRAFVEQRAAQLPVRRLAVRSVEPLEVDGLEGFELIASAEHGETGAGRFVYQVILFEPDNYWIAVGLCSTAKEQEYLPHFRRVVESFRRTPVR